MINVYVGNLPFSATEQEVRDMFAAHGTVERVNIITDRMSGRPRGFGFVEMSDQAAAEAAIAALNGTNVGGRSLTVNIAKPKSEEEQTARDRVKEVMDKGLD